MSIIIEWPDVVDGLKLRIGQLTVELEMATVLARKTEIARAALEAELATKE